MALWDRDLAWLAVAGDRAVGGTLATIVEGSGWIDVIGVLEPWRGKGIGRALLLTQFRVLAARGAPEVALNVDSGNATGAPSLYASAGMRVHRAWGVFEKRFDATAAG
jgi:mycothiol synthase